MVGIIVVAHGPLAKAFLDTINMIVGDRVDIAAISIDANDNSDTARERIKEGIKQMEQGSGVLILTDMFGGSPSNISLAFLEEDKVEVVTGLNLPMIMKLVQLPDNLGLKEAANLARETGQGSILIASNFLSKEMSAEGEKKSMGTARKG